MTSESIKAWLESQDWFSYFNWLLSQPSDPYVSALFIIGVFIALVIIIFICVR
jgi:hypothetical protein